MKKIAVILICVSASTLYSQGLLSYRKTKPLTPSSQEASPNTKPIYISLGLSVANGSFNDYKVGNANQFYQFLLQDQSLKLDDGALGFKYLGIGGLMINIRHRQ